MALSSDYLKPQWQKKRLEIMERDNFTCVICGEKENTLNVHHGYYKKGSKVWDYDNSTFSTLCNDCHKEEHVKIKSFDQMNIVHLTNLLNRMIENNPRADFEGYYRAIIEYTFYDKDYIMPSLVDGCIDVESDIYITSFSILEAALYHMVNWRNIGKYALSCMCWGNFISQKDIILDNLSIRKFFRANNG